MNYKGLLIFLVSIMQVSTTLATEVEGDSSPQNQTSNQPILNRSASIHPVISNHGMVVSREAMASRIGADMLVRGGNAVDAAVATGFALAVTFPQAGNIGGGGFMMIHLAKEDRTIALDYREIAPAAVTEKLYQDDEGNVDHKRVRHGHQSIGVPGTVAGLVHAQKHYGKLTLREVMAPAIKLAKKGFKVGYPLAHSFNAVQHRLAQHSVTAEYFLKADGSPYQAGEHFIQKDLAWTLSQIAKKGAEGFYQGKVADEIVAEMERGSGLISHQDLAAYKVVEREPVRGTYRGYEIVSMPPPSSGGVHLIQMLNILEGLDVKQLGHNSAYYIHALAEVMRRAYADRSKYLGDPDFYDVPVEQLLDKDYAKRLREGIDLVRATPSSQILPGLDVPDESPQTTHFATWDGEGNVVSNTYTLNYSYGSGIAVTGTGFLLNNEMDDFSSKAGVANSFGLLGGKANSLQPHKRPLSSMTPTLVFKEGKPWLAVGSQGGSSIINTVLQVILNTIEFDMNIAEATAAPRVHHQWHPDRLFLEPGISPDTQRLLLRQGHQIHAGKPMLGRSASIRFEDGKLYGFCGQRWPGGAAIAVERPLESNSDR